MTQATEMAELDLDLTEQQLLQEALSRRAATLNRRERRAELLTGGAFVLAAPRSGWCSTCAARSTHPLRWSCTLGITVAMRVRFDVAGIFTVPSQLAFVPLLFCVPPQAVPPLAVLALAASTLPEVWRGDVPPSRLVLSIANGWFAVGPAFVLLLAGGPAAVVGSPR